MIVAEAEEEREPVVRGSAPVRRDGFGTGTAARRVLDRKVEIGIGATPGEALTKQLRDDPVDLNHRRNGSGDGVATR